jgi:hypothetical protein
VRRTLPPTPPPDAFHQPLREQVQHTSPPPPPFDARASPPPHHAAAVTQPHHDAFSEQVQGIYPSPQGTTFPPQPHRDASPCSADENSGDNSVWSPMQRTHRIGDLFRVVLRGLTWKVATLSVKINDYKDCFANLPATMAHTCQQQRALDLNQSD